jgi:hypothetical protein
MDRDAEIVQAARSIVVHLPALLGEHAEAVAAQLESLLAERDRQPEKSVTDRILDLLTGYSATRDWMAGFLRLSAPAADTRRTAPLRGLEAERELGLDTDADAEVLADSLIVGSVPAEAVEAAVDTSEPAITTYGLLSCPETVAAGQEFDLEVGLSCSPAPGVSGPPLNMPSMVGRTYTLSVLLLISGFRLRDSESARQIMEVTADAPYPTVTLHLTPESQDQTSSRRIKAMYSVDGQPVGFAVRYVTVVPGTSPLPEQTPTASGENLSVPAAPTPADLTVYVLKNRDSDRELAWLFDSPHGLNLPDQALLTNIGAAPADFARNLTNHLSAGEGQPGVFLTLRGKGREIASRMPRQFWPLLTEAADCVEGPPTVLFITDQPYVPWELAYIQDPLKDGDHLPPFLCAQATVGRWLQKDENAAAVGLGPVQPPPVRLPADTMAVVSAVYGQPGVPRLKEAEAECADLADRYGAARIDADAANVQAYICGDSPTAEIVHFALHGKWDPTGSEEGLVLVDGMLSSDQVEGGNLPARPLVFLNACQVGQASEVLGDYAGMAAAFLKAGASAVIAPLWSIDDATARSIALSFYKATLEDGAPPAEILRRIRAGFKADTTAQSSTYLAYQFFGDPRLELVGAHLVHDIAVEG